MTDPVESIKTLGEVLCRFGELSGYQVSQEKSVLMGVAVGKEIQDNVGMFTKARWRSRRVRYF